MRRGCSSGGFTGSKNKQERESEIGQQDGRGGIQMNVENSVGTCAHRDEHNDTMMPKR